MASGDGNQAEVKWGTILRDRSVLFLLAAVALFHLANAPILPVTALYIKQLGGSSALTTFTVLSAQLVMVPVAWATGRLCDSWGRKPIMAVAFWVLPFRILSYTLAHNPHMVVFLQALDGVGAGIYSVAIVAFAADLTRGKGQFNSSAWTFRDRPRNRRGRRPNRLGARPAALWLQHHFCRICHTRTPGCGNFPNSGPKYSENREATSRPGCKHIRRFIG